MKYTASFSNNSTVGFYEFATKAEAIKGIKEIATGNTTTGNTSYWSVYLTESHDVVARGCVNSKGRNRNISIHNFNRTDW